MPSFCKPQYISYTVLPKYIVVYHHYLFVKTDNNSHNYLIIIYYNNYHNYYGVTYPKKEISQRLTDI